MSGWDSFESHTVHVASKAVPSGVDIFCRKKGKGEGLLLLHGYPQTHHIWVKIANQLAEKYTVVVADLRGYGQSSKPKGSESHVEYCKKEMAADQAQVMSHFGFETFYLVGHDRGGRVAHRLAVNFPSRVKKLMVLDILPTLWMYEHTDMQFARALQRSEGARALKDRRRVTFIGSSSYSKRLGRLVSFHGVEEVILAAKEAYWNMCSRRITHSKAAWDDEAIQIYQDAWFTPECVHSTCEDYRAAASIDLEHDRESLRMGEKLKVAELKVIWGGKGMIEKMGGALDVWRGYCDNTVQEKPAELLKEIEDFMR